jgi:PhnB protein
MTQLDSYLFFDGTCAEAMRFYEKALGGKLEMMLKASESPPGAGCPEGTRPDAVMHACVEIQGKRLMASDWMGGQKYPGMGGFSLALNYPTANEATKHAACSTRWRTAGRCACRSTGPSGSSPSAC